MLGTPIWPDMRVPGPRLKNPGAIPVLHGLHVAKNKIVAGFSLVFSAPGKGPFQTCKAFG